MESRGKVARPKGGKTRSLPLSVEMARALWTLRGSRDDEELVFASETGQRIASSNVMRRVLKPAAVDAGLGEWVSSRSARGGRRASSWVGFHTFRHTCATRLIRDDGWSLERLQVYLGHADSQTTRRFYVHLVPKDLMAPSSLLRAEHNVRSQPEEAEQTGAGVV
ncbi:MAG: site-specific integrase [Actinomycetota bacterium]|nr:site-specific integrase [Actinomycetota bacterium]